MVLSEDHQSIDGLYETYLAAKLTDPASALAAFGKYKATLLRHIKCEEDLIFPILAKMPEELASQEVHILREEHQIIVPLLMEVEKHLRQGTDASSSERKLFEELHEHNAREEMRVYGSLDNLLSGTQKEAVFEALKSIRFFR
jgi:hemerythrin superfamily protein